MRRSNACEMWRCGVLLAPASAPAPPDAAASVILATPSTLKPLYVPICGDCCHAAGKPTL